ncbi:ferritin-like domain-containing protein [Coleofasciculus sp. FACHB-T130]|uniref:ferritin-like domain-containing protein n=1 Tax=Cyanophyceae TaxID=3028117 RepID=UPI001687795C|nr:ferritin-like domain-containing protein [Coleofasciculus sp. FACHB-T130]MBD1882014.1 ferritin-like domain-containing protein [Coleofasciculus sp. FACHB-T130]
MNQYQKTAGFDLPHIPSDDKLHRVLSSALKSRLGDDPISPEFMSNSYWDAAHFGLEKVKIFQDSSQQEQAEILRRCSSGLLEEAYFIEKAGVGYMAKMVLLAETTEERMLYALFSSDEVTHLAQISRFLPEKDLVGTDDPFLRFLADLVETQDKTVLLFVLQVVLEGWGLSHYRSLAKDCVNPQMAAILEGFLQDESRHHGTGVTLFNQMSVSQASQATIIETLALFLQMVRVGPQSVVTAIEQVKGHLSRQQKLNIFQELDTETHSGIRLNLLRSLMRGEEAGIIVQELEDRGAFQPFPAEKCV